MRSCRVRRLSKGHGALRGRGLLWQQRKARHQVTGCCCYRNCSLLLVALLVLLLILLPPVVLVSLTMMLTAKLPSTNGKGSVNDLLLGGGISIMSHVSLFDSPLVYKICIRT